MEKETRELLVRYAEQYETADFLDGDPSWFMHQVSGSRNQEAMAFVASCLSYGSRQQFMQKIRLILDAADGDVDHWIRSGHYERMFAAGDRRSFYRLYNNNTMCNFLNDYRRLLSAFGTLGNYVLEAMQQASNDDTGMVRRAGDALTAIESICHYFNQQGMSLVVPKDTQSACKRVCMFLRWMVRSGSPVDLGLWSDFIDRRQLIVPMDTHVLSQSVRLGLLSSKTATMSTARRLTAALAEVFPDDPLKGDFALFGYGVNHK